MIRTIGEEEHVYLSSYYFMELNTSRMLLNLDLHFPMEKGKYGRRISELEESMDFQLDLLQKQAVEEALTKGVVVVTGGPGTGKTTTINLMILLKDDGSFSLHSRSLPSSALLPFL